MSPSSINREKFALLQRHDQTWHKQPESADSPPIRALALSGGGIRSATFSLGVVQAIAQAPTDNPTVESSELKFDSGKPGNYLSSLLSTFDYLSTVSGGGYLGSFLCSLFIPKRRRNPAAADKSDEKIDPTPLERMAAADEAIEVLTSGAPSRIRGSTDYSQHNNKIHAPLAWLRENGRYLTPTGFGDLIYSGALALRNWASLHVVIGLLLMTFLALLAIVKIKASYVLPSWYASWEFNLLHDTQAIDSPSGRPLAWIWWSPLTVLSLLPILTIGTWAGTSYWLVDQLEDGNARRLMQNKAFGAMLAISVVSLYAVFSLWPSTVNGLGATWSFDSASWTGDSGARKWPLLILGYLGTSTAFACGIYCILVGNRKRLASQVRRRMTQWVAFALKGAAIIMVIGLIDTIGQTLYLFASKESGVKALSPAGLAAALVWVARSLTARGSAQIPSWAKRLPLSTIAGTAGALIMLLIGGLWSLLVISLMWGWQDPITSPLAADLRLQTATVIFLIAGAISLLWGLSPGFINLSSLHQFYASRLTRAYLGASNQERFFNRGKSLSSAEPLASDQVRMRDYYSAEGSNGYGTLQTLAPIHIINVTANKTVDPSEQLVQRDRKGQPLAVLPWGLALDGSARVEGPGEHLTVGEWTAISGAAFSTGIGRETSLGMSLLMGVTNVRLGRWVETLPASDSPGEMRPQAQTKAGPKEGRDRAREPMLLRMQYYLDCEFRARFHGTKRKMQYLTDGGHFENTALYELLRSERRVDQIFVCDCGADPDYGFGDLGNLIRLARIDLHVEVCVEDPDTLPDTGPLRTIFGHVEDFTRLETKHRTTSPVGLLLYATKARHGEEERPHVIQIVLIKPHVPWSAPMEIREYAHKHKTFPQEATTDQFYDEAQWESYRALGHWQAKAIFRPDVMAALDMHRQKKVQSLVSASRDSKEWSKVA